MPNIPVTAAINSLLTSTTTLASKVALGTLGVGTAGFVSTGNTVGCVPILLANGKLPAVDGSNITGITASMVGLGNVNNTLDTNKPVSVLQQTALDFKANLASPSFTGTVVLPTGTISAAPLKFATGVNLTNPVFGSVEFDGTNLLLTNNVGSPTRKSLAFTNAPTFTGVPVAPTATSGTNNYQIATTEFVQSAIQGVVGTAPAALNTLNELAVALNNDASYASTITTALSQKAPIANPNFTGDVIFPAGTEVTNFSGSLSGDVTGNQSSTVISATTVTGKALMGYASAQGTISTTDTILSAICKLDGNKIGSDLTGVQTGGGTKLTNIIQITQGAYNLLAPANSSTLYIIVT